jgi:hypothetical protein
MKLEQLYRDIQERLDVGDKLWADEGGVASLAKRWKGFIEKLYAPDYEPNTEDEEKVLAALMGYFQTNKSGDLGAYLKDLLPLKSKFPKILDPQLQGYIPASSEETEWVSNGGDYVWRGATMPLSQAKKLIQNAIYKHSGLISSRAFITNQPNITYNSRGEKGFTSFSSDLKGAIQFKGKMGSDSVTVIYGVKKSNPNLVMNPEASDSISMFQENETLYVGDNVEPDVVIINDVRILGQMYKEASPWVKAIRGDSGSDPTFSQWESYGTQWAEKANLKEPSFDNVRVVDFQNTPKDTKMKSLEEIYTEIRLSEVGEGTSEPFKYKKNFERGKSFGYMIDGYVKSTNNKPDLEVPIKLQGLDYDQDIEDLEPDFIEFLSLDGSDPEGTLNGIEVIFSHADRDTFALVNDVKFMFRLMATIKQILQKEFSSSMPDVLLYSPTKEGSEAIEDTGRHRLYKAFIQKAFPSARMFVDDRGEEIIFKLK